MNLAEALVRARAWEQHHVPVGSRRAMPRSLEEQGADAITAFAGSMRFVYLHTGWFALWIILNAGLLLGLVPFDPFPYGLLTLIVSLEAIFLSTFVMIAQNRLSAMADARAQADYEVNVRAEAEIAKLVHLLDALVAHEVSQHEQATVTDGL